MRRFTVATLVMAVALLTACDDDTTGPGSIVGTYTLQTFNGMNLPVVVDSVGPGPQPPPQPDIAPSGVMSFIVELTAGSVRLNSGNTCSVSLTFRTTDDGTVTADTETETCTYSVTGTTIQLDFPGEAPITGTISGNTITFVDEDGDTFVFTT